MAAQQGRANGGQHKVTPVFHVEQFQWKRDRVES